MGALDQLPVLSGIPAACCHLPFLLSSNQNRNLHIYFVGLDFINTDEMLEWI
jgi:hypothetical protein